MGLFTSTPDDAQALVNDLASEFRLLQAAEEPRLARMRQYRKEIEATRENPDVAAATAGDYGRGTSNGTGAVTRHSFNLPFSYALTIKHSFRVAGRLPDAQVARREETEEERNRSDVMEKLWWGTVRASKGAVKLAAAAHDASQLGAACLEVYWDARAQMPMFRDVDPSGVVAVKGLDDPHDFQRLYRFWEVSAATLFAEYRDTFVDDAKTRPVSFDGFEVAPTGKVCIVQMSDRQRTVRFALGFNPNGKGRPLDVPLMDSSHHYGFVNYVVIPNLGPERAVWGWADYDFVREIASYIPTLFGREADILRMVSNGAMKSRGTKLTPRAVQEILRRGGVVPVGKDGDVEPIQAPEVPSFEASHADRALHFLEMLGFAPAAAWGDSGAASGSDRGLQLGPMLELTMMKQLNFGSGLSRLGAMVFRMAERLQAGRATYRGAHQRAGVARGFTLTTGPGSVDPDTGLSTDPKELIAGDYEITFSWPSRLDPDDPAFVASELNKFAQGTQSLRTTLERFGCEAPEDEIKLIEQENQDHPWLRQGMIRLLEMQMNATQQGANDGSQNQAGGNFGSALDTMTSPDGQALDADAMAGALPGGTPGSLFGAA